MASRIAGITIEIGGNTTKLQTALKGVDNQLRKTQDALKDVNKLLKLDPGNTELLTQKQKNLENAIKQTKERLIELKNAQSQVKEGTDEWDRLQREIIDTEQNLKSLEKQYRQFGSVAAQQIKVAGEGIQKFGNKVSAIGDKLTTRLTVPIVGAFTIASGYASDLEENMNKLDVAFGDSAQSVKNWAKTAGTQYGLSQVAATDAASGFGALAKGVGIADNEAANMSTTLAGLSADLGSYFNVANDVSAKALEGIFTGESEALKKFGVVMNDTNLQQFAADHNLVWKEMSQTEKVMLRYQFVLEKTKDAQGDYSRTSDGTANSIKTFQAAIQDLMTVIGGQLLPIITPIIQNLTNIISAITQMPEPIQKVIVVVGLVLAAIGPLLSIGGRLIFGIGALLTYAPAVVGAFSGIIAPVLGVVAVIAGLIAIGVALYKNWDTIKEYAANAWQNMKDGWQNFKDNLTQSFSEFGTAAKQSFSDTWNNVKSATSTAWNNVKTNVSTAANNVKSSVTSSWNNVKSTTLSIWQGIKDGVASRLNSLLNSVHSVFSSIRSYIANAISAVRNTLNFSWSLPRPRLPVFRWQWIQVGRYLSVPWFSIEWYRKAYDNPIMFTNPTVLQTPYGMKGFGDGNGSEIVLGMDKLRELVGGAGDDITINVYASPGMNVNELAEKIQDRLVAVQRQRSLAYGT